MYDERFKRTIRKLLFVSPTLSKAFQSGGFRSVFKGRGIEFDSVREYAFGDDARSIDWNASVRFGRPLAKTWREDRSLAIYFVYDQSASMDYGFPVSASETAALTCSLIAYAASLTDIPLGAVFFSDTVRSAMPARAGRTHALAMARRFVSSSERGKRDGGERGTALAEALNTARRGIKRRSLVFIVSDFMVEAEGQNGYAQSLALLARQHDAVAIRISCDDISERLKSTIKVRDAESGRIVRVSFGSEDSSNDFKSIRAEARLSWLRASSHARASSLEIETDADPAKSLWTFFERRRRGT